MKRRSDNNLRWLRAIAASLLALCLLSPAASADAEKQRIALYFFHSNPCESCQEINRIYEIADAAGAWDLAYLTINEYREYTSPFDHGVELIEKWFDLEAAPETPFLVVGNTLLQGYDEMTAGLAAAIAEGLQRGESVFSEENAVRYGSMTACPGASESPRTDWKRLALPAATAVLLSALILCGRRRTTRNAMRREEK